jgi:hypothetical protein
MGGVEFRDGRISMERKEVSITEYFYRWLEEMNLMFIRKRLRREEKELKKLVLGLAFVQGLVSGRVTGNVLARDTMRDGNKDAIVRVESL